MISFNPVTFILACLFVAPVLKGAFGSFSREKIKESIYSLINGIGTLLGISLSVYLMKRIFFERKDGFYREIYSLIPPGITYLLEQHDVLIYAVCFPLIFILVMTVFHIVALPLYGVAVPYASGLIYSSLASWGHFRKRALGGMARLPASAFITLLFAFCVNLYSYYFYSPVLTKWINASVPYQILHEQILKPVLNSGIARQIPVIVNDSFRKTFGDSQKSAENQGRESLGDWLDEGNARVIRYFNGVTLEEAVKSSKEIDKAAVDIVAGEEDSTQKGYLIYNWISRNIQYDYDKASKISQTPDGISSGAITAYKTGQGICFDYSSLYVAMCRAVGLKVRLVTGLGYSGMLWGDHAWNQIYSKEESRWINVDCTFGEAGNYYDKPDFNEDHQDGEIQGEW